MTALVVWVAAGVYGASRNWDRLERDGVLYDVSDRACGTFLCLLVLLMGPFGLLWVWWMERRVDGE